MKNTTISTNSSTISTNNTRRESQQQQWQWQQWQMKKLNNEQKQKHQWTCPTRKKFAKAWRESRNAVVWNDRATKIKITSQPKGGTTLQTQIMFSHLGILDKALNYSNWIHNYHMGIYNKEPGHGGANCISILVVNEHKHPETDCHHGVSY